MRRVISLIITFMDRESFLETVRQQYAEEIQEAYYECEHEDGREIDYIKLNQNLARLMQGAMLDGLPPADFEDLVRSTLPQASPKLRIPQQRNAA